MDGASDRETGTVRLLAPFYASRHLDVMTWITSRDNYVLFDLFIDQDLRPYLYKMSITEHLLVQLEAVVQPYQRDIIAKLYQVTAFHIGACVIVGPNCRLYNVLIE